MDFNLPAEAVKCQYVPDRETLARCENLGHTLGVELLKLCEG